MMQSVERRRMKSARDDKCLREVALAIQGRQGGLSDDTVIYGSTRSRMRRIAYLADLWQQEILRDLQDQGVKDEPSFVV